MCLTKYPECCRRTACEYRDYIDRLTLSDKNKIPEIDETAMDRAQERSKQYFTKRT